MTGPEFAEVADWITARWGPIGVWSNPARFATDFTDADRDIVWRAVFGEARNSPEFPPKPTVILARVRELAATDADPSRRVALPETTGGGTYTDWSIATFGEVVPVPVALDRITEQNTP